MLSRDQDAYGRLVFDHYRGMPPLRSLGATTVGPPTASPTLAGQTESCETMDFPFTCEPLPIDVQGFVRSFAAGESAEMAAFYDRFGFVVVRDALSHYDCERTLAEIWDWLEAESAGAGGKVTRGEAVTWVERDGWPAHNRAAGLLSDGPWLTPRFLANRQTPVLYEVCAALLRRRELVVSHDRAALFRPTRAPEGGRVPCASTVNLHFDMNPWSSFAPPRAGAGRPIRARYDRDEHFIDEHNATGSAVSPSCVQGLFNLVDNREQDGGFLCVPGMQHHVREWAAFSEAALASRFRGNEVHCTFHRERDGEVVVQDPTGIHERARRVTLRAGSLLLWSPLLPHGSAPNDSTRIRAAQFLKVAPASAWHRDSFRARMAELKRRIRGQPATTPRGDRMLGLSPWPGAPA